MAWNDIQNGGNSNAGSSDGADKIAFTNTPVGTVLLRVVDAEPISRWTHWIQSAQGGKGISVTCIGKGCPCCKDISEAKKASGKSKYNSSKKHALNVINRTAGNKIEVLDKGNKIFGQMVVLIQQMGDIRNYDITITRVGEEVNQINYTVLPKFPPTPLSAADIELSKTKYDIKEVTKAYSLAEVNMFIAGSTMDEVLATRPKMVDPTAPVDATIPFKNGASGTTPQMTGVDFGSPMSF